MSPCAKSMLLLGSILGLFAGCANLVESRTITEFAEALQQDDLPTLKRTTSDRFQQKTLRLAESLDDIEILRIPEGKVSVVKIRDVTDNEKHVTVEVGESKRELLYKLTQNKQDGKWVVDDIYLEQKRKGLTARKSVTETMDLLLTVREFLAAWSDGTREEALAVTTPELKRVLADIPPAYLAQLTEEVVGKKSSRTRFRPEAHMDEDIALVRLPRTVGKLLIKFELLDDQWKVSDISLEATRRSKDIVSVHRRALVVGTTADFLEAFAAADKQTLSGLCTETFYRSTLKPSDLSLVSLPSSGEPNAETRIEIQGKRADFILQGETEVMKVGLVRQDFEDPDIPSRYLVEEVTLYELDGTQEKRLSAVFTGHARVQIFAEALAERNLPLLKTCSTHDFNERVWSKLNEDILRELHLAEIENAPPEVISMVFRGSVTEITAMQGSRALTYVMRDRGGELRIDDILMPVHDRPNSLKTTLELLAPIYRFAAAIRSSNLNALQRICSYDFNRLVWSQTKRLPDIGFDIPQHLQAPLHSIHRIEGEDRLIQVTLGDNQWGARVFLKEKQSSYLVDEILIIAGQEPRQQARLKHTIRIQLAYGIHQAAGKDVSQAESRRESSPAVRQVGASQPASEQLPFTPRPFPGSPADQ